MKLLLLCWGLLFREQVLSCSGWYGIDPIVDYMNSNVFAGPPDFCVHELVAQQARRSPAATALSSAESSLTYAELEFRAGLMGEFLCRNCGVVRGDQVGISLNRTPEMLVVLLGVLKAGAAYVPLDPTLPSERLGYIAADSQLRVIVTVKGLIDAVPPSTVPRLYIDEIDLTNLKMECGLHSTVGVKDLAYILYTSGSTGSPKGVEVTHGALLNFLCSMRDKPGCSKTDVLLAVTTLSFDISALELFLPLIVGGRVELASSEVAADGRLLRETIEKCKPTMMQATPATWRMLIYAGWRRTSGLVALCGGEGLPRKLADDILDRTAALWNMYGPTETTIWSTLAKIEVGDGVIDIGMPIANTQVYVLDETMHAVTNGAGELYIGGRGVARGYRNLPEETAKKFVPDPFSADPDARLFRTGDVVRSLPSGSLVHLGRLDSQVQIHGFRIELEEIQTVLGRHQAIEQAVVSVFDDNQGIKELVAYIICRRDGAPDSASLRAFLRSSLPDYMVPSYFVFLKEFPLTANNKIDIKALPNPTSGTTRRHVLLRRPRSRLETQILAIWRQILETDELGIYDSFFDAGGNSLKAIQILAQVEQIIGFRLPLNVLFQMPTVAEMADCMSSEDWTPTQRSLVSIQRDGCKVPFFAIPGAGGNVLMFARLARLLGPDQPFYGLQASGVDSYEKPFESVEEMASQYISEICTIQPAGPYFIGGSCTGGVVAYEMAQQLVSQGQQVALAILDSAHPSSYQSYLKSGASLWRIGYFWSRGLAFLKTLLKKPFSKWPTLVYRKLRNNVQGIGARDAELLERSEFQIRAIYHDSMAVIARYRVREYPGKLLNVVAIARPKNPNFADTRQCWETLALAGSQNASIAAVDSGQLFVSPHVEVLAQLLGDQSKDLQKRMNKNNG